MTVFAPSTAEEVPGMLATALSMSTPDGPAIPQDAAEALRRQGRRRSRGARGARGDGSLCVLAVGKMAPSAYKALELMGDDASKVTLYDVRVLPPDPAMIDDALRPRARHDSRRRHPPRRRRDLDGLGDAQPRPGPRAQPFPTTRILGTPRAYLEQHRPDKLLAELGLDAEGLAAAFSRLLADQPEFAPALPESPRPNYH